MDENQVLEFLRENKERFLSGEEVSRKLKVSRAAVWKSIQGLRGLGYEIEAQPHLGYRLLQIPDKMFSDEIAHKLRTKIIGKKIFSFEALDSTNDTVFRLGEQGAKEGLCVFAEFQRKGRGRLGRSWTSPKGKNLIVSVLLRPNLPPSEASKITLVAAVSLAKAVREIAGLSLGIKWPNDLLYNNKKVGGILTEMSAEVDRVNFVVLGVGLNINSTSKELPPNSISLKEITGSDISRVLFAQEFLRFIETDYLRLKENGFQDLAGEWEEFSVTSGRRISATVLGRKIQGQAVGIDKEGALWIRKDNGLQEKIMAGDVELLRPMNEKK